MDKIQKMRNIKIVGFGNSITEAVIGVPDENKRWLNILRKKLSDTFSSYIFTTVNSGIGGNSAREAMARFAKDVLSHEPDFVILEFGGNNEDLAHPERIVGKDEFRTLLEKYKNELPQGTRTIAVTFPPVLDDLHSYGKMPQFADHYQKAGGIDKTVEPYREITRKFASENSFPLYDFHDELKSLGELNGRELYTLNDGVHLTEEGNKVLADGVFRILGKILTKEK